MHFNDLGVSVRIGEIQSHVPWLGLLLLFSMFVMLWQRFVIFCLGVLCMCTYVMHSPNVMLSLFGSFRD